MPNFLNHLSPLTWLLLLANPMWLAGQAVPQGYEPIEDIPKLTQSAKLRTWAQTNSLVFWAEWQQAATLAQQLGWPLTEVRKDGRTIALQGFDDAGQLAYHVTHNLTCAAASRTDQVWPGGDAGLNLTGQGTTLLIWEPAGRPRPTHNELNGRVTVGDGTTTNGDHPTHVAGTMAASGSNPNARGMSYQANIRAFNSTNDLSEMATEAANNRRLSNHSYGFLTGWEYNSDLSRWEWWGEPSISASEDYKFGRYSSTAADLDEIIYNAPFYLAIRSAGNNRNDSHQGSHWVRNSTGTWVMSSASREPDGGSDGYDCIPHSAVAKNIITVGAIEFDFCGSGFTCSSMSDFSGWGPTDDGRIKPDLVARGVDVFSSTAQSNTSYDIYQGTSMATPTVTGSLNLLLQHYGNLNPGFTIRSSALKALAIHTAEDFMPNGPDYRSGWGLMDTRAAADFITASLQPSSDKRLVSRDSIANGNVREYQIYHDGSGFSMTLVWSDPPGVVASASLNPGARRLVNDLDLRLISQDGNNTYQPWVLNPASPAALATKGDNIRDNVEQIYEPNLPAGFYTIRISHKNTLSGGVQFMSYAITGLSVPPTFTCTGNTNLITCNGSFSDGSASENYSNNLSCSWTIAPPGATSITLNFSAFNTESCCDKVRVYNGPNASAPLLAELSGTSLPAPLTSTTGQMFVQFVTDESVVRSGWNASYNCTTLSPPTAAFVGAPTQGVTPLNVQFTNQSTNSPTTYLWDFGNGQTSTLANPNHTYSVPGTYTVRLTATNAAGNHTATRTAYIRADAPVTAPVAAFSSNVSCGPAPLVVQFTDQSTNTPTSWSWSFPGGAPATSTQRNPTVQYQQPGQYTVTLTATNAGGANTTTQTAVVSVLGPVSIQATPNQPICAGTSVQLQASGAAAYQWTGPGLSSSTGANVMVQPPGPGVYTYQVVGSQYGCTGLPAEVVVTVTPAATIALTASQTSACIGESFSITATGASQYIWSGEGVPNTSGSTINVVANTPGVFTYEVSANCAMPAQIEVTVTAPPQVQAAAITPEVCVGQSIELTASGADNYLWLGPFLLSNLGANVSALPPAPGSYSYVVTGSNGNCSSPGQSVTVEVTPSQTLTVQTVATGCPGPQISFTAQIANGGPLPNVIWYLNGQPVWSGPSYTLFNAANGDAVFCEVIPTQLPDCVMPAQVASEVYIVDCLVSGVADPIPGLTSLYLAPNPSQGDSYLFFNAQNHWEGQVQVFNALGQMLWSQRLVAQIGPNQHRLALTTLAPGLHWVVVSHGAFQQRLPMVILP